MANTVGGLIRPGEGGEPSPNNIHPATVRHPASTCTACDIGPARLPSLPCTWLPSLPVGKSAADPRHAIGLRDGFGGGGQAVCPSTMGMYTHRRHMGPAVPWLQLSEPPTPKLQGKCFMVAWFQHPTLQVCTTTTPSVPSYLLLQKTCLALHRGKKLCVMSNQQKKSNFVPQQDL